MALPVVKLKNIVDGFADFVIWPFLDFHVLAAPVPLTADYHGEEFHVQEADAHSPEVREHRNRSAVEAGNDIHYEHDDYEGSRIDGPRKEQEKEFPVWLYDGKRNQNPHDRATGPDHIGNLALQKIGEHGRHNTGGSANEVEAKKSPGAKHTFHVGAKIEEAQHIRKEMHEPVVEELIGDWRPDIAREKSLLLETEPGAEAPPVKTRAGIEPDHQRIGKKLYGEDQNIGENQALDGPRNA